MGNHYRRRTRSGNLSCGRIFLIRRRNQFGNGGENQSNMDSQPRIVFVRVEKPQVWTPPHQHPLKEEPAVAEWAQRSEDWIQAFSRTWLPVHSTFPPHKLHKKNPTLGLKDNSPVTSSHLIRQNKDLHIDMAHTHTCTGQSSANIFLRGNL